MKIERKKPLNLDKFEARPILKKSQTKESIYKQLIVKQSNSLDRHLTAILDSPMIEKKFSANIQQKTNVALSQQNQFPLLNKHRFYKSYHDLILENKSKKISTIDASPTSSQLGLHQSFSPKSNLYNLEKLKKSGAGGGGGGEKRNEIDSCRIFNKTRKHLKKNNLENKQQKHLVTLESIKPTVNILNACKSIDYISNIMKSKSELNRVRLNVFNVK